MPIGSTSAVSPCPIEESTAGRLRDSAVPRHGLLFRLAVVEFVGRFILRRDGRQAGKYLIRACGFIIMAVYVKPHSTTRQPAFRTAGIGRVFHPASSNARASAVPRDALQDFRHDNKQTMTASLLIAWAFLGSASTSGYLVSAIVEIA